MSVAYKAAYSKLGEERVQPVDLSKMVDTRTEREIKRDARLGRLNNAEEQFWAPRIDQNWSIHPGYFM